jgi:hypothetical protein
MTLLQKISSYCVIANCMMNLFQFNVNTISNSIAPKSDCKIVKLVQKQDLDR